MANHKPNRKVYTKTQFIFDRPQKVLVGTTTTKSGVVKNKYAIDKEAKIVKKITHRVNHRRIS